MKDNFTITEHGREQRTRSHMRQRDEDRRCSILTFCHKSLVSEAIFPILPPIVAILFSPRWKDICSSWKLTFNAFLVIFSNESLFKNQH